MGKAIEVEVTFPRLFDKGNSSLLMFFNAKINGAITIYGLKLIEGQNGKFVSMPNREVVNDEGDKKYYNHVWIDHEGMRKAVVDAGIKEYEKLSKKSGNVSKPPVEDEDAPF